jgi:hypothetical protein
VNSAIDLPFQTNVRYRVSVLTRRERITSAQVTGLAAAYAQIRRLDLHGALAEIATILAGYPDDARARILADAASAYVDGDQYFSAEAAGLLRQAGADLAEARRMYAGRHRSNPLRIVSDQANRQP